MPAPTAKCPIANDIRGASPILLHIKASERTLAGCASSLPVDVAKAYLRLYYLHIAFDRPDSSRMEATLAYIVALGEIERAGYPDTGKTQPFLF